MRLASILSVYVIAISLLTANGYTAKDVQLLSEIMYLENGSTGKTEEENRNALILTGAVVINRTKQSGWGGDTIEKVLYSPGQYAKATKDRIGKVEVPQYIKILAFDMLAFGTNVPDYIIFQSMNKNLGTHWKTVAGTEYFATGGGHKDEGVDFTAKTNGSVCDLYWNYIEHLQRTYLTRVDGAGMGNLWRNCINNRVITLDMLDQMGRGLFRK